MRSLRVTTFAVCLAVLMGGSATAAERTFKVGGDEKNTNITFQSEADFEMILGHSNSASGTVVADLEGGTGRIEIRVPVASLDTGIELRNKHIQSGDWLDAKKSPELRFVSTSARRIEGNTWQIDGDFTCHGVTKPITLRAEVRPIAAEAAKAAGLGKGEWLRVTAPFDVRLSDHGVQIPQKIAGRVNDTWKVTLSLFLNAEG